MNRLSGAECCVHGVDLVYPTYCKILNGREKISEVNKRI